MHPAAAAAQRACTLPVPVHSPAPSFPVPPPWRFPPQPSGTAPIAPAPDAAVPQGGLVVPP